MPEIGVVEFRRNVTSYIWTYSAQVHGGRTGEIDAIAKPVDGRELTDSHLIV